MTQNAIHVDRYTYFDTAAEAEAIAGRNNDDDPDCFYAAVDLPLGWAIAVYDLETGKLEGYL